MRLLLNSMMKQIFSMAKYYTINDGITFQADCVAGLERSFHDSVAEYLEVCAARGRQPEKPYSGEVALRLPSDLHRESTAAAEKGKRQ